MCLQRVRDDRAQLLWKIRNSPVPVSEANTHNSKVTTSQSRSCLRTLFFCNCLLCNFIGRIQVVYYYLVFIDTPEKLLVVKDSKHLLYQISTTS